MAKRTYTVVCFIAEQNQWVTLRSGISLAKARGWVRDVKYGKARIYKGGPGGEPVA